MSIPKKYICYIRLKRINLKEINTVACEGKEYTHDSNNETLAPIVQNPNIRKRTLRNSTILNYFKRNSYEEIDDNRKIRSKSNDGNLYLSSLLQYMKKIQSIITVYLCIYHQQWIQDSFYGDQRG